VQENLNMAGTLVPLVLIPRYTSYAGDATAFTTIGMDVTEYEKAIVSFWRSNGANFGSIAITFEESMDQLNWTTCAGGPFTDPGAGNEGQFQPELTKRWFRIKVTPGGANVVVSCWCIGFLMQRET
jgi:hypothetical protein